MSRKCSHSSPMTLSTLLCVVLGGLVGFGMAASNHRRGVQNFGKVLKALNSAIFSPNPSALESPQRFCILLPSRLGQSIGESEGSAVSYCTDGITTLGSRPLPPNSVLSAHLVKTESYVQITGSLNVVTLMLEHDAGGGGQYDDASWGIEPFSTCVGHSRYVQLVGGGPDFCLRCCTYKDEMTQDYNKTAPCFAGNDTKGCRFVVPGNYGPGFSSVTVPPVLPPNAPTTAVLTIVPPRAPTTVVPPIVPPSAPTTVVPPIVPPSAPKSVVAPVPSVNGGTVKPVTTTSVVAKLGWLIWG
ncbi:hypothetical protein HDU67_004103 [Dinochytrium kinnereticum]|nr:hypothetical protein HDU67_004103 [Dinochytrium kinnereticum]